MIKVFVLGLLVGWLIEWVIDWAWWRCDPAEDTTITRRDGAAPGRHGGA